MERRNARNVNQEELAAPPSSMLPPSGRGNANKAPQGQGQRVDGNAAMDPKILRRIAASREYSQRYRMKQLQYITKLEDAVRKLEAEVAITAPRIKYADAQNSLLRMENGSMKEKLSGLTGTLMMKQAEYQELKTEKVALKHLSLMQRASQFGGQSSNQARHYGNPMMNVGMDQPGFNQFVGGAAPPPNPMMQNQDLGNAFGYNVNNGEDRNPM